MVSLHYINCILAMAEMIPNNNVTGNNVTLIVDDYLLERQTEKVK